jgi:hypothetical protein
MLRVCRLFSLACPLNPLGILRRIYVNGKWYISIQLVAQPDCGEMFQLAESAIERRSVADSIGINFLDVLMAHRAFIPPKSLYHLENHPYSNPP